VGDFQRNILPFSPSVKVEGHFF